MAIAIREIPVLTGQSAIDFVNETDKYSDRPVPRLSLKREMELQSIKEAHKHFVWGYGTPVHSSKGMHKTEEIERVALKRYDEEGNLIFEISDEEPLHTRMMYFDLKKM